MHGLPDDEWQLLRHDLVEAYGNLRVSVLAMKGEADARARLGWLVMVERSAQRLGDLLAKAEPRWDQPAEPALPAAATDPSTPPTKSVA